MKAPVAIVGAGLAGLTAARHLQLHDVPFALYESGKQVGGLAQSYLDAEGFVYDFGAHFINNRLAATLGISAECRDVKRYGESVLIRGEVYDYPFGLMRNPRYLRDGIAAVLAGIGRGSENDNAAQWFRSRYGASLADEVALPLLEAWSGVPARELAASVGGKLRLGIAYTLYLKAMSRVTGRAIGMGYSNVLDENPSVYHVYPLGGIACACQSLAASIGTRIRLESPVEKIWVEKGRVRAITAGDQTTEVSAVVSTAPAPVLAGLVQGDRSLEPVRKFQFRPMISVNLRYRQRPILTDTVLWTPENIYPFFRVTEAIQSMPWLAPQHSTMLTCDIGEEIAGSYWRMEDEELGEICARAIERMHRGTAERYAGCRVIRIPNAYPIFLKSYEAVRERFELGTGIDGLYSIGRNGEFNHILMEDVYWRTTHKMNQLIDAFVGDVGRNTDEAAAFAAAR